MSLTAITSKASQPRPFSLDRLSDLLALDGVQWRHDLDSSLTAAVHMARFQHEMGVRATYYVMARSPYYNPFSYLGYKAVSEIAQLGHDLAVHCDLNMGRDEQIEARDAGWVAEAEHAMLRELYPGVTRKLSFHCPSGSVLWRDIPGFESAYGPQWQGRYFADSGGSFRYGDPEDSDTRPLQVNLHPEWWFPSEAEADLGGSFWR